MTTPEPRKSGYGPLIAIGIVLFVLIGIVVQFQAHQSPSTASVPPEQTSPLPAEAQSQPQRTVAQTIAYASGLSEDDPTVANNLKSLSEMCHQTEQETGDQIAKATSLVNEVHKDVTIADFLREAVKTQPLAGGDCVDTFALLVKSIQNVP